MNNELDIIDKIDRLEKLLNEHYKLSEFEKLSGIETDLTKIFGVASNGDVVKLQRFFKNIVRSLI